MVMMLALFRLDLPGNAKSASGCESLRLFHSGVSKLKACSQELAFKSRGPKVSNLNSTPPSFCQKAASLDYQSITRGDQDRFDLIGLPKLGSIGTCALYTL